LIADTDGNIFGGFTPVGWGNNCGYKGDDSLRSFLFTLRNPHGVPPRKFALKAEKKQYAIKCYSEYCALFGSGCEIGVRDNCNANINSFTNQALTAVTARTRTTLHSTISSPVRTISQ
jgi:hypothetical protein